MRTYNVPGVVVTATRTEKHVENVGRSVTVLSGEQLKNSLVHSVAEALSVQEGIYLIGVGQNFGMNQSIFMRGAGTNQTAVMVDGVRLSDPSGVNNALDFSELSLAGWDRIEIVRGSHSTLFGSSAVGGVINLITKQSSAQGFSGDAELRTGTFGAGTSLFSQDLSLQYHHPSGLFALGEFLNTKSRGLDATVDTVTQAGAFRHRDRDGLSAQDIVGKVGYRDEVLDLYAMFRNHSELKDIDKSAYVDDDNATIDFKRRLWTYGATYWFNDRTNLKLTGGYSDMHRVAVDDSSVVGPSGATDHTFSDTKYNGTMQTNELQATIRLSNFEIVLGAGMYRETMNVQSYFTTSSFFGAFEYNSNLDSLALSATTRDVLAQLDLNGTAFAAGWERLSLIVGARWNRQSAFGDYTTVEFNPAYKIGDAHLLYGSYSTGFNAPSLYQLYTPERDFSSDITRGNRALQAERSRSLEIGWRYFPRNGVRYSVSYVRTLVENSIEYIYLWDKNVSIEQIGQDYLRNDFRGDTYLNLGSQTTDGVEATASIRLSERFSFSGNISLLRGKLEYRPSEIDLDKTQGHHVQLYSNGAFMKQDIQSTDLVRRPATIHLSFIYRPIDAWTTRLDVKHAGQRSDVYYDFQLGPFGALGTQPVDAYTLVDLTQHVQLNKNWAANLRVENLFNKEYLEIKGFTTRGRGIYLNVQYEWEPLL